MSLLAGGALLPASGVAAEGTWSPAERISEVGSLHELWTRNVEHARVGPRVAIDGQGRVAAGWLDYRSTAPTYSARTPATDHYDAMAALGTPNGDWGEPELVAPFVLPVRPTSAVEPALVGNGVELSWWEGDAHASTVAAEARRDGEGWTAPDRLELPSSATPGNFWLWRDADGGARAVWMHADGIAASGWSEEAGWSPPAVLPGAWVNLHVVFDRAGTGHVFMQRRLTYQGIFPGHPVTTNPFDPMRLTASWNPSSGWSAPMSLGVNFDAFEVRATASGEVIAVWESDPSAADWPGLAAEFGNVTMASLHAAVRSAAGSWSPTVKLTRGAPALHFMHSWRLELATGPDGDAALFWMTDAGLRTAVRPAGGTWSELTAELVTAIHPPDRVALNERGEAIALWGRYAPDSATCQLEATIRPVRGPWSAPRPIGALTECTFITWGGVDLALNSQGQAVVLAKEGKGADARVSSVDYSFPGRKWSEPAQLSTPGAIAGQVDLALNERGEAVAVWEEVAGERWTSASASAVHGARTTLVPQEPVIDPPEPVVVDEPTERGEPAEPTGTTGPTEPTEPKVVEGLPAKPKSTDAPSLAAAYAAPRVDTRGILESGRAFLVHLKGRGAIPAGTRVELAHIRGRETILRGFASRLVVLSPALPRWARLVGRDGRASEWRRIVLDRARPSIRRAALERGPGGLQLRVSAGDDASGVVRMQLARTRSRTDTTTIRFRPSRLVDARSAPRWVRVQDAIGRFSDWVPLRGRGRLVSERHQPPGAPNQVVRASARPASVPSPTQAT